MGLRPRYERVHGRKMAFDEVVEVMGKFGGYVPSKRSILGIVDQLGPLAQRLTGDMPVPEGDGEVLVIQSDDKGAPISRHAIDELEMDRPLDGTRRTMVA